MPKKIKDLFKNRKPKKENEDNEIEFPKKAYIKEHKRLVKELKPIAKEYKAQKKDLKKAQHYKED